MLFYKKVPTKSEDEEMKTETKGDITHNSEGDVNMSEVKPEDLKEEIMQSSFKVSESLRKFIEQDNKAYQEELKQAKDMKSFNADFFKELQKTVVEAARVQMQKDEGYLK